MKEKDSYYLNRERWRTDAGHCFKSLCLLQMSWSFAQSIEFTHVLFLVFYGPFHFQNSYIDFNKLSLTHLYKIRLYINFLHFADAKK